MYRFKKITLKLSLPFTLPFTLLLLTSIGLSAQTIESYPSNWWVGMKNPQLQIMLHAPGIGNASITLYNYPGVTLKKVNKVDNSNYLFLDLQINPTARAGTLHFKLTGTTGSNTQNTSGANSIPATFDYTLQPRRPGKGRQFAQGVDSHDLIYLLIPDRFSNGDPANDKIPGLRDQSLDRDSIFHRHGGDLKGIINHLDYLQDLGVTTLWMLPVWQNDMPDRTEHGYAITNHYNVEPRLGTNADYRALGDSLHKRGMKLIQDAVYNHVGLYHFFVQDKPTKDWLHEWPAYTNTTYKDQVLFDPYAATADRKRLSDGWFTPMMPDLNQNNPYVANFLIQHAIWSVEAFGVDGWRVDTYIYNDLPFMNRCNQALLDEYPNISIFGETWVHGVPNQSYFCCNTVNTPFKCNLPATTDFQQLFYGIQEALTKPFGWTEGVNKLYTTTAQDYLYSDPTKQVIFLDNHDLSRFYSVIQEDTAKYKMALSWLLTFRGVPQLYYGNENLMTGVTNPDGWVRLDFKGGWPGDPVNQFSAAGRDAKQNAIFNHIRTLARYRQHSPALQKGKLLQFVPEDAVYVYFRISENNSASGNNNTNNYSANRNIGTSDRIMCIMNTSNDTKTIDPKRFSEGIGTNTTGTDLPSNTSIDLHQPITLRPWSMLVLQLK
ncbi:alpha-amylase family glycosyl hydrolase [Flavihumibacter petaseus]|uniref:Putative glycosidase n=1 Tax=Flavihumibacter petaseus NBRC 106054 TaxID=1220578 RepID=A0A0E9N7L1_9BACT|nr:alpha-amylase family glycosyl hydrolase [Flavihumibacter petaseus]GAO45345.1 putative glycosidase [Flavihumibacter petaseus NBRC 106054]